MEGGRDGGREGGRDGGREGGRQGEKLGVREGGRDDREIDGGREKLTGSLIVESISVPVQTVVYLVAIPDPLTRS